MQLSEAIRLGAMWNEQAFGTSLDSLGRTCALGAALDAIGKKSSLYCNALDAFSVLGTQAVHPVTRETLLVMSAIRELNDTHRWTRERIADWVESIERREEPQADAAVSGTVDQPEAVHAR